MGGQDAHPTRKSFFVEQARCLFFRMVQYLSCYRITLYCHCKYFQGDRKHCQSKADALPNIRDYLFYGVNLKQTSNLKSQIH